ncbi:UNVERIFIED_CONTAM: Retrovirus-related Pol polyprotein from transposon TNT 1-94 [Sesamum latifolium]|uniref:Retrovirus-related Pol polyprotein from transposon TNT 1-94 n=1 Tax=Sesamum latifolium TaxID=2727402 RepID=A0AAW2UWB0_9LAMI
MDGGSSVQSHGVKMLSLVEKLKDLKVGLKNDTYIDVILQSLPPSYDPFIVNYNLNGLEKSIHELINILVQYEAMTQKFEPEVLVGEASTSKAKGKGARRWKRKKGKVTTVTATASTEGAPAAPMGKGKGKVGGSQRPRANDVCTHCQGKGHWKRECPQLLSNPGMFVVEVNMISNSASWVLDTGCGAHICNNLQVLERSRKLSKDKMVLRLGDGKTVVVEAVGSLSLVISNRIRIDLKDCFYVPSHISKDRIRRLVDSKNSEIDDLDHLPTCESCLKGKMTKKRFVGQSAIANGLLDLVHTDVCGSLSTLARGGISYFITLPMITHGSSDIRKKLRDIISMIRLRKRSLSRGMQYSWKRVFHRIADVMRSTRESRVLERYGFVGLTYQLDNDPKTYGEAMSDIDSDKWLEAMKFEMDSMGSNQVWTLVDPPKDIRPVGCKWVYKRKLGADGEVTAFKARLVAKGYTQRPRVDFEKTYSPVAMAKSIRILLAIAACWRVSLLWRGTESLSSPKNDYDPCIYKKISGSSVAYLVLYVDDILLVGNDVKMLGNIKAWLSTQFSMKDMGLEEIQDGALKTRTPSHKAWVKLSKKQSPKTDEEFKRMSNIPYASTVGSIQYAVQCTRPDVAYALSVTSRYQACAGMAH